MLVYAGACLCSYPSIHTHHRMATHTHHNTEPQLVGVVRTALRMCGASRRMGDLYSDKTLTSRFTNLAKQHLKVGVSCGCVHECGCACVCVHACVCMRVCVYGQVWMWVCTSVCTPQHTCHHAHTPSHTITPPQNRVWRMSTHSMHHCWYPP